MGASKQLLPSRNRALSVLNFSLTPIKYLLNNGIVSHDTYDEIVSRSPKKAATPPIDFIVTDSDSVSSSGISFDDLEAQAEAVPAIVTIELDAESLNSDEGEKKKGKHLSTMLGGIFSKSNNKSETPRDIIRVSQFLNKDHFSPEMSNEDKGDIISAKRTKKDVAPPLDFDVTKSGRFRCHPAFSFARR